MPKPLVHLVFSSHWDREWYLPFQQFRAKLIKVLDTVLEELETGRLSAYQMDGQFVPVEDYLKIRPEKEPLLRQLVTEGRFKIGPWYTLPDEFLVSGESIARNFQMGMRRAEAFGQSSTAGWLCDLFGHNSQMPQILNQLGIRDALLWRGVPESLKFPFRWRAADGSEVLSHGFGMDGYCDFGFQVRGINSPTPPLTASEMTEKAIAYLEAHPPTAGQNILWVDGADHIEFDPAVLEMMDAFNRKAGYEAMKVSTLDDFLAAARAEKRAATPTWTGELREVAHTNNAWLIPGVGSSRIPLKQANHACETLLTLWAEPWCAYTQEQLGLEYPATSLDLAWEYLLKNHPHDSICGCSTDETHAAMPYRFDQCKGLAQTYLNEALHATSARGLQGKLKASELGLSLFAPVGGDMQAIPEALVRLPREWPGFKEHFGFEPKPAFRIFTAAGKEVPYQLLQVLPHVKETIVGLYKMPRAEDRIGVRVALDTALAPAEARHLVIRGANEPTRISLENPIGVASNRLHNAYVDLVAEPNGTLTLSDLGSGRVYRDLLQLEDNADIGDGWFHGTAVQDRTYLSTGGRVTFGLTENGSLLARLHIRVEWEVPSEFLFDQMVRSEKLVPLVAEHVVTLRRDSRYAEIQTTIHNTARDHRLRMLCPTGLAGARNYSADSAYDAVERPIALESDRHLWKELQYDMTPQQNWVAVAEGKAGLALLAPGQYESAVLDQPERPLCVTLLRAFRRAVFTDGNEGGQIPGPHRFVLGLAPLAVKGGEIPAAQLSRWAQNLAAPVRVRQLDFAEEAKAAPTRTGSAPWVEGDVVISASYAIAAKERVIRFFNPAKRAVTVRLIGGKKWEEIDLREKAVRKISGKSLSVGAKKVVSLRVAV